MVARLENGPITQNLSVTSPTRIEWLRSGSLPETTLVTFEVSENNGASWALLDNPIRMQGGWELPEAELPLAGQVRATARWAGGYGNSAWSLSQTVSSYDVSPLRLWRFEHFETYDNSGDAADHEALWQRLGVAHSKSRRKAGGGEHCESGQSSDAGSRSQQ